MSLGRLRLAFCCSSDAVESTASDLPLGAAPLRRSGAVAGAGTSDVDPVAAGTTSFNAAPLPAGFRRSGNSHYSNTTNGDGSAPPDASSTTSPVTVINGSSADGGGGSSNSSNNRNININSNINININSSSSNAKYGASSNGTGSGDGSGGNGGSKTGSTLEAVKPRTTKEAKKILQQQRQLQQQLRQQAKAAGGSAAAEAWADVARQQQDDERDSSAADVDWRKNTNVFFFGLDGGGKSTAVLVLHSGASALVSPSLERRQLPLKLADRHAELCLVDLPGNPTFRAKWKEQIVAPHAIVFVVDSSDLLRIDAAQRELHALAFLPELAGVPILVLLNKRDVPGALGVDDLERRLQLTTMFSSNLHQQPLHCWKTLACSATSPSTFVQVRQWLSKPHFDPRALQRAERCRKNGARFW